MQNDVSFSFEVVNIRIFQISLHQTTENRGEMRQKPRKRRESTSTPKGDLKLLFWYEGYFTISLTCYTPLRVKCIISHLKLL
jgi:hypothetical protein